MFANMNFVNAYLVNWDVSSVVEMSYMFLNSQVNDTFRGDRDINEWDVSNVNSMEGVFQGLRGESPTLTKWCLSNINSEPGNFAANSALTDANKPTWGTCPTP